MVKQGASGPAPGWCDSGGGGAEIIFGGTREAYLCEFERGATRNLFQSESNEQGEDQKKKVFSSKISTTSSYRLNILAIFHEFFSEDQKKGSSFQKFYEIRCESTKIKKIREANTNLGLDLHSSSPEPVDFFGA